MASETRPAFQNNARRWISAWRRRGLNNSVVATPSPLVLILMCLSINIDAQSRLDALKCSIICASPGASMDSRLPFCGKIKASAIILCRRIHGYQHTGVT